MNALSAAGLPSQFLTEEVSARIRPVKVSVDLDAFQQRRIYLQSTDTASRVAISAYKRLRTSLMLKLDALNARSTMITGVTAGVGKTTTAINLAVSIAHHSDVHVLLVDLDLRTSPMAAMLGIEHDYGLERVGERGFRLGRAGVDIGVPGLTIYPAGAQCENSTELLAGKPMRTLMSVFAQHRRRPIIVYDCPPILGCDDVAMLAPQMESALLVVEEGRTRRRELAEALPALGSTPLVGVVMNKSSTTKFVDYYY